MDTAPHPCDVPRAAAVHGRSSSSSPSAVRAGDLPKAIDVSHHLSDLAAARRQSPLKSFSKYMGQPGLISLAGGLPDPSYFPFSALGGQLLAADTFATNPAPDATPAPKQKPGWLSGWFGSSSSTQKINVPKNAKVPAPDALQLSTALQYGGAQGLVWLQHWLKNWVAQVSPPAYEDWDVLVTCGATAGWSLVVDLLCNHGDAILVEAWTYPSAIERAWPQGSRPIPCPIDAGGLVPETFEKTLAEWDEEKRGCKRPRVLYTVPVGQNPCGSVATIERKRAIYNICVKYDVILCEDDPYYILQFPWESADAHKRKKHNDREDNTSFLASLSPSYLTIDTEGRVIRLETFSKTIAPGSRLGFVVSNARFSERLLRGAEVSTQQPSGLSQVLIAEALKSWGSDGWVRWLRGLRGEYRTRRDVVVDALHQEFKIETIRQQQQRIVTSSSAASPTKMVGYAKYSSARRTPLQTVDLDEKFASFGLSEGRLPLITFSPPEGGMFVWLSVCVSNHPRFKRDASPEDRAQQTKEMMNTLWERLAMNGALLAPGWMFEGSGERRGAPDEDRPAPREASASGSASASALARARAADEAEYRAMVADDENGIGHFRLAFSYASHDVLRKGVKIFAETVIDFFDGEGK